MADIEQFALENLNEHKKGLLGKTVSVTNMLAWTKVTNATTPGLCSLLRSYVLPNAVQSCFSQLAHNSPDITDVHERVYSVYK